jgi:hypothetical protein
MTRHHTTSIAKNGGSVVITSQVQNALRHEAENARPNLPDESYQGQ